VIEPAARPEPVGQTGVRLALALLGYFILVTLVITLSPFDFARRPVVLSYEMSPSDILANIAMFLPVGFLMRSLDAGRSRSAWRAVLLAAALSALIELAQTLLHLRFVSPVDVLANTCGGFAGVLLRDRVERWAVWRPGVVGRVGLDVPLVGLLYLLVPQLWLSGVGLLDDPRRSVTTLLLGCAGCIVLVGLRGHRWQGGATLAAGVVPPIALLWFTIGALPSLAAYPRTFAALAVAVLAVTWWLLRPGGDPAGRRFETDTLRRFLPVFALYVVVASLWPPFRSLTPWHGAVGFANRLNDARVIDLLELLEQVGGLTLLGYAAAEWRGRRELSLAADLPLVTLLAAVVVTLLEAMQGRLEGPGASLLRALLSMLGAMYGVAVYHLARAHVRALRAAA
jgi:VanZ family protein